MNVLKAASWKELVSKINEAKVILNNPETIWYRGHANSNYHLLPSLLRLSNGLEKEKDIFHKFKQISGRVNALSGSDWELVYSMQHYWIPTRLLDWSESAGVPLFFASKYNSASSDNVDAALFILDPIKMNEIALQKSKILYLPEDKEYDFQKLFFENYPIKVQSPIAVSPFYSHGRLFAQKGVFTIHPSTKKTLEEMSSDCLVKIIISRSALQEINEVLAVMGINEISIFPDIQGAAEYFKTILK